MSHLERVSDGADSTRSNFAFVTILVLAAVVLIGLVFLWGGGYFGNPQSVNVIQPASPTTVVVPGTSGAAGAGGAGGAAGAPGAAGAAGAAGAPAASGTTSTP